MNGWGMLAWRGTPWRTPDTPEAQRADRPPRRGLRSGGTHHLPPGADMGRPSTYYRVGAQDRVVAYATPARPPRQRALPAAEVARIHPLVLQAAIDLAEGDLSRLRFTDDGQVEVTNAPRNVR